MHGKWSILMLASSGALALTLAACGPGPNNNQSPRRGSIAAAPAQIPPQVSPNTHPPRAPEQVETNPSADQAAINRPMRGPGFAQISGGKGYITRQEARRIPWLEIHFSACDTNKDGRITLEEFNECRRRLAEPKVGQPSAAATSG